MIELIQDWGPVFAVILGIAAHLWRMNHCWGEVKGLRRRLSDMERSLADKISPAKLVEIVSDFTAQLGEQRTEIARLSAKNYRLEVRESVVNNGSRRDITRQVQKMRARLWAVVPAMGESEGPSVGIAAAGLQALRRANADAERIAGTTLQGLAEEIRNARVRENLPPYICFFLHGVDKGVILEDAIATPPWLAEHLDGFVVAVFASCRSHKIGYELAGIVPNVITMREDVKVEDAQGFVEALFRRLISGDDVHTAYTAARAVGSFDLREMVRLH